MYVKDGQSAMTLGEWLCIWIDTYKKPNLRPNSLRNLEQMIRLHAPCWLKEKPLTAVTALDIDRALAQIQGGRTRQYERQTLHAAFGKALKLGLVSRNVVEMSEAVRYQKQHGKALSARERHEFLRAIEGTRVKFLMLFYLYTGVRRAEALSLAWSDIDETEALIFIHGTKTEDSERAIPLSDVLQNILFEQHRQNEMDKIRKGRGKFHEAKEGLVFPFSAGYVSRAFKALCPAHHLHDLRHTYITLCAESGVNVRVCQQLVGHSTAALTLNVYTHVIDEYKRKEAAKFTLFPSFYG